MKLISKGILVIALLSGSAMCLADVKLISENISKAIPGLVIKDVQQTPVKSVFQVTTDTGEVLFSNEDGQYFFTGDLYSIVNNKLTNLSEIERQKARTLKVNAVGPSQRVVFPAKGERKGSITVFTDIDCGYCRKLHREVPALNEMGVEVSYLAYPRAGINSESYDTYVSVWCADDKLDAMTRAKSGLSLSSKVCDNPVADQYNLGREIGISGTPAIILDDGKLIPGYINAAKVGQALGIR